MVLNSPSRTAQRVALRRAAHQLWDYPKVFDDPLALKIVGHKAAAELASTRSSDTTASRALRAFLVARARFAEDQLALAVARGVKQYVVLGAGLDTFAYRNPFDGLRVFEVDYPATQAWKRKLLNTEEIDVPQSLAFAPVHFGKDSLARVLAHVGFKADDPAFFSWLGVTPYLSQQTVLQTLDWIISACVLNSVVFDYIVPRSSLGFFARRAFDALCRRVAAAGEPLVGFFDPEDLARALRGMGYVHREDLGGKEINARYFSDRKDKLQVHGSIGRLMCARG